MACCGKNKKGAGYKENAKSVSVRQPKGTPSGMSNYPKKIRLVCNTADTVNPDFRQNH